jgi:hypothetical protein
MLLARRAGRARAAPHDRERQGQARRRSRALARELLEAHACSDMIHARSLPQSASEHARSRRALELRGLRRDVIAGRFEPDEMPGEELGLSQRVPLVHGADV